jgi:hypothetical protein
MKALFAILTPFIIVSSDKEKTKKFDLNTKYIKEAVLAYKKYRTQK